MGTSPPGISPSSKKSVKRNTARTICVTLSFDYAEWEHPIFVEAQGCVPLDPKKKKQQIRELMEELEDRILDLFGVQVLPLLTDEGVFYGGAVGKRIVWYHRYPQDGGEYTW